MPKPKDVGRTSGGDRVVYSEFGSHAQTGNEAIERPGLEVAPQEQKIRVQASRKGRKGKTVTIVSGFQAKPETLTTLLKELKGLCGAGGTVKDHEIEIQGDHVQKIVQELVKRGYKQCRGV